MSLFRRKVSNAIPEQRAAIAESFKNEFVSDLANYWARTGEFNDSLEKLTPNGLDGASALFTLADLCRIHLERLIGAVQEDTAQKWKWQNRQMLNLAKKLSEEDVSNLKYLYRDIHSREYPELYLVPKDFMEKYEANPSDPSLSFSVTLYETLLFKTEFLQWVNLGQNSIFSDDMKRLFKIKEDARQEKLAMDFVRWNLEQDDSE